MEILFRDKGIAPLFKIEQILAKMFHEPKL